MLQKCFSASWRCGFPFTSVQSVPNGSVDWRFLANDLQFQTNLMGTKPISEPPKPARRHLHSVCFSFFISLIRLLSVSKRAPTTNFTLARRCAISPSLSLSICHKHPYTERCCCSQNYIFLKALACCCFQIVQPIRWSLLAWGLCSTAGGGGC